VPRGSPGLPRSARRADAAPRSAGPQHATR
jgi:hypothetical protein